jgi:penicillin-binding protein 1C
MPAPKKKSQLVKIKRDALKKTSFLSSIKQKIKSHPRISLTVLFLALLIIFITSLISNLPGPKSLTRKPAPVSTQILDRNGKLLYEVYSDQNRTPVDIADLPDYVKWATISIEDKNFYHHFGLDFTGIIRAAFNTLRGKRLEGGSTITQQLVKIALLQDNSRTITRKIKEAILSIATEIAYSKDEIIGLYLNNVPYGGTTYGIQTAAKTYFKKDAKDLTLAQATLLAGLPQAPSRYSPYGSHPEFAKSRQEEVLRRMREDGHITTKEEEQAKTEVLEYAPNITNIKAPHFALLVKDQLSQKYGEDLINLGGLRVTTTLNLDIQEYAQASVSSEIDSLTHLKISNGAALITKPSSGEVIAMVGSKNYFNIESDGQVNITTSFRQPGSSIKPINYVAGILNGWTASTMYLDYPTCFKVEGQTPYCPKNYDGGFHGPVQMRSALANSYNIPAVKQLALNGIESMVDTAKRMGITHWQDLSNYGLSLTLGGGEVTMMELSQAFGTFANSGISVPLVTILKVEDYQGNILEEYNSQTVTDYVSTLPVSNEIFKDIKDQEQKCPTSMGSCPQIALPEEAAFIISNILADNSARTPAFGSSSLLKIKGKTVSVKTGTTNEQRDNWTIGYTPDFLVAVWVGNNDNTPMSYVASGVTGASPIWNHLMKKVLEDIPDKPLKQPQGIVNQQVCLDTGLLAVAENQCPTRSEFFMADNLPPAQTSTRRQIWVRRSDKVPLMRGDDTVDLDLEEHTLLIDPFGIICTDCAYPTNEEGKISYPVNYVDYNNFRLNPPSPKNFLLEENKLQLP